LLGGNHINKLNKKGIVLIIVGLCFSISIIPSSTLGTNINFFNTIIVPDDYLTIQEALDNANNGYTIFVRSGIYHENIIINKSIYLIGEDSENTIIDGGQNSKNTITIISPNITVHSFSIINAQNNQLGKWDTAGIQISSSNNIIKDNLIMWNLLGVNVLDVARNLTIVNNTFIENSILLGNYKSINSKFTKESFLHNITGNTVNGKPLYYYKNLNNFKVPNDAGQILLANCSNITINNSYLTQCNFPIILGFCSNCIVENNTLDDTYGEFIFFKSDNCTIQNNIATNLIYGICLDYQSEHNIVRNNEVAYNYGGIVVMAYSHNNLVYNNNMHHNSYGFFLLNNAHDNKIKDNKIHENEIGVKLQISPYDNKISNNIIKKCLYAVMSIGFTKNYWNQNYYNRPRVLPKPIFTYKMIFNKLPMPYFITGFDFHPAKTLI
jgi:parallel beta-helix repeat protein